MGQIRKQTIQSSFLIYIGFIIGAINTYLFARFFTQEEFGLTQVITSIAQILAPLAGVGMTPFMNRFFPYYFDNLENKKNDLLTVAIVFSLIGSVVIFSGSIIFEPLVIRKFSTKSPLVIKYYYWSLVCSFFYLSFLILESYMGALKKTVLPAFMKETAHRLFVLVLIALYATQLIGIRTFVILFCCIYLVITIIMVSYLLATKQLHLSFTFSHITKRFRKRIANYIGFVYGAIVIHAIATQIAMLALAGARDLSTAGIFALNQYTAAILQVPYRSLQSIAGALIATHWKNKNLAEIERIYKRSSINLLLISLFLFINIWLNYDDGLTVLGLYEKFGSGKTVFLILGIYNILELGTGVNAGVLVTSPAWRFDFYSGVVLLVLSIPLNVLMARWMSMEGVAFATLITFTVYNLIRLIFIKQRFNMWPFSVKTLYGVLLAAGAYLIVYLLLGNMHGIVAILLRSLLFSASFIGGVYYLHLTPDFLQVLYAVKKRLGIKG
jgi:O-antigen/teichoic acid export membrane protein